MPRTEVFEVTCSECGTETTVGVERWAATLYDPPDATNHPEECPRCGHFFTSDDTWEESEPPEPNYDPREEW